MVTIAGTTAIDNAFATSVAPDIDNDIDIATVVDAIIATAVDIVSKIVVVAIVEPRVQFPAGAPSVCLTNSGTVPMVPSIVHQAIYTLSHSPSLIPPPFN